MTLTSEALTFGSAYMLRRLISFIAVLLLLSSCEKEEKALVLPPSTGATPFSVDMGGENNYDKQVFFDFELGEVVLTSDRKSWDLAFEASPEGIHIFMNGGHGVYVYNTHKTVMNQVREVPAHLKLLDWQTDASCGQSEGTGVGSWYQGGGDTKGEVYIVWLYDAAEYRKMRVLAGNSNGYTIEWAPLESTNTVTTVQLEKDTAYNYIYFSFAKGIVKPEPRKDTWDIVFTRYRPLVFNSDIQGFMPYPVSGVLLNPSRVRGAADSTRPYAEITLQTASNLAFTRCRDIIGYDWKSLDDRSAAGVYTVNRGKNYVVQTRNDQLFKLRFLDYYNSAGVKGNPLFEYTRLR